MAGLAKDISALDVKELIQGLDPPDHIRVVVRVAQNFQCHDGVGHGREDGADAPFTLHPVYGPAFGQSERLLPCAMRHEAVDPFEHAVDADEYIFVKMARHEMIEMAKGIGWLYEQLRHALPPASIDRSAVWHRE